MSTEKDPLPPRDPRPPGGDPRPAPNLAHDLERLAVPGRSLFEGDDATPEALLGVRRANPLSVAAEAVKLASGLITLLVLARMRRILAGDPGAVAQILLAVAVILAGCALLSLAVWRARTWELTEEGVVRRWGLGWGPFSRRSLTIPYEHIHTVSMSSTLLERLLGLMTLDLDTGAAASEGDASKISGLRAGEAEALRAELFRRKRLAAGQAAADGAPGAAATTDVPDAAAATDVPTAESPAAEERPLATFELSRRELVLAAASRMSVVSQAVVLVGMLANGLNQLIEWGLLDLAGAGDQLVAAVAPALVPLVLGFVVAAVALGAAVSFVLNLVRYAGYRVERYADRVVVEHGLLARSSRTLAAGRVQHVSVRQGLIRQLVGYAEVSAWVVAAPGESDDAPAGSVTLHPFLRVGDVEAFLAEVLPDYAGVLGSVELGRLGPAARRRALVRAVVWWPLVAALAAGGLWLAGLAGLVGSAAWLVRPLVVAAAVLSVVLLAWLVADALRAWGTARYGHTARALVLVTGGLTRLTVIAPRPRLQRVEVRASFFQRRSRVATLSARTASDGTDGLELRDLPADAADELLAWFRLRRA